MDKGLGKESLRKQRNQAFPSRKVEQEYMMFREIFVKPKERELEAAQENEEVLVSPEFMERIEAEKQKIADKHFEQMTTEQKNQLDHSNMMNESGHNLKKASKTNFLKNKGKQVDDNFGDLDLLDIIGDQNDNIIAIVLKKFNTKKESASKSNSFFVQ